MLIIVQPNYLSTNRIIPFTLLIIN